MKNLSLILNGILILAVAYLYMDKFSAKNETEQPQAETTEATAGSKIVFVNADSLLTNYAKFQAVKKDIEAREQREDKALKSRGRSLENDAIALQKEMTALDAEAAQGNMSRVDYEGKAKKLLDRQQKLGAKQQRLMQDQERIAREIMMEGQEINDELQGEIKEKLEALKAAEGYEYILSYGAGSNVLVADGAYDITDKVLAILNAGGEE